MPKRYASVCFEDLEEIETRAAPLLAADSFFMLSKLSWEAARNF
jgi:hypothetical protein